MTRRFHSAIPLHRGRRAFTFAVLLIGLGSSASKGADESPLTAIQEELRNQQYLAIEPSGKLDEPTIAALKRFQMRNGLQVTGDVNAETLQALAAASKKPEPQRDFPVTPLATDDGPSARERAREVVVSDREFLQKEETRTDATVPAAPDDPRAVAGSDPHPVAPVEQPRTSEGARTTAQDSPAISRPPVPDPRREPREQAGPPRRNDGPQDFHETASNRNRVSDDVARVLEDYLDAAQGPTPDRELSFYGDRVRYFDTGTVSHSFIEKDQSKYYRRWPERKFRLVGEPEIIHAGPNSATVRFRIHYSLRHGADTASGSTENILQLENGSGGYKIVGIKERKVSL